MKEEKFSPEQSLQLIQTMISKTRQSMSDNSIYFLTWGWIIFTACIGQYVLKHIFEFEKHYLAWLVLIVGFAFAIYQGRRNDRIIKVRTYVDESMKHLWAGMGITFLVLAAMVFSYPALGKYVLPFYIMLYGLGTFVSGSIIQFKPLVIGGIMAWALAIGAARTTYDNQLLFGAAAIMVSYIIPAYMLRNKSRTANQKI